MQQKNNNTIPFIAQQQKFAAAALQSSFDTAPKNPMKMAQKVRSDIYWSSFHFFDYPLTSAIQISD